LEELHAATEPYYFVKHTDDGPYALRAKGCRSQAPVAFAIPRKKLALPPTNSIQRSCGRGTRVGCANTIAGQIVLRRNVAANRTLLPQAEVVTSSWQIN
jgi:hypothetical protein